MKRLLLYTALILTTLAAHAQHERRSYYTDDQLTPREHLVDFTHLRLEIDIDPKKGMVEGSVQHDFTVLQQTIDTLWLDAVDINIKNVKLNGKAVKFSSTKNGLIVRFEQPLQWETKHQLDIEYSAFPKKGMYFIGWNDPEGKSRKQVWTQGQGIDNRHWIPMYDTPNDKVSTELFVTFLQGYKVLSNGQKMSEKNNKNGTTTWHYVMKKPHATYLIMLGIGEYEIKTTRSKSGVPMSLWYYPDWEDRVEATYKHSEAIMDFMEEKTGFPYPWVSYAQIPVQDFMYGAMENTTATIFGDFYGTDEKGFYDRNYVRVNAHELAHQWFGNLVTARSSAHHWLQESFATHYDLWFQRIAFGEDHYNWERRKAQNMAIMASKDDQRPIAHSAAGTIRHYPKGAHVLQMLKYVVGEAAFNKTIHHYLNKHQYQNVDSEDLLVAFHETLGLSLDWFWEEWIYRGGEPEYEVTFNEIAKNGERYGVFNVTQVHMQSDFVGLFDMPIVFEIHYEDGSKTTERLRIHEQHHQIELPLEKGKKVSFPLFDPNNEIMKSVRFEKTVKQWLAQADGAENMLDRYDAIEALSSTSIEEKRNTLKKVFNEASFYVEKEAILKQLLYDPQSYELVKSAAQSEDPQLRSSLVKITGVIPAPLVATYEQLLDDPSYEVVEHSLRKLCFLFPEKRNAYLERTKDVVGVHSKNVRIQWLEIAAQENETSEHINELVSYTAPAHEFRTRILAAEALQRLNYFDTPFMENCIEALFSFNSRLRGPMLKVMQHYYEQQAFKKTIYDYVNDPSVFDTTQRRKLSSFTSF
jgi:aminopeptidase N